MKIFKYRILNHILFWIFIYAFYTTPFILSYGFESDAFINLIYLPFDILTVYFVIGFLIPQFFIKKRNLPVLLLGVVVAISLNILISRYINFVIQPRLGFWVSRRAITVELFNSLLTNFMIVGTAVALKLFSYSTKIQLNQSELERKTVQSELGILRSQVNPHFLFNVLNNIDALIFEDKEKASNAIFLLSKIMRYMLQESTEEKVMLDKELAYINDYLELAKLSFENPAFLKFEISGSSAGKLIPPLLFIPVIENAVKHCNKQAKLPGIQISFKIENGFIELKTSNHVKRNDFKLPDNSSGNGLKNVKKRLELIYRENFIFDINRDMDKFDVYLKVPLS
ncbi:MAG: histidine kinase [Prolixibacteraceae bacterium]|nr:histidine kinase [Prolixibacteraceae bacterium]